MTSSSTPLRRAHVWLTVPPIALALFSGCGRPESGRLQGYVEGEFVYVSPPLAGELKTWSVERGAQGAAGEAIFALDTTPEKAARDEAERRVRQARANWEDMQKGRRPSEIESLEAQLRQAKAALELSELQLA